MIFEEENFPFFNSLEASHTVLLSSKLIVFLLEAQMGVLKLGHFAAT